MKSLILSITLLASSLVTFAQHPPAGGPPPSKEAYEKMRSHKIAYLTDKLELTPEEAQAFWPVYNEMEDKLHQLREENRPDKGKDPNEMSDAEIEALVNKRFDFRQQELDLEKEYHEKFKQVLTVKKVAKLYRAEESFRRELLKKLREEKGGDRPEGNRPPPR